MKKNTYSQKLKDPRWQKKRLEILQRDGFACRDCLDDASTLHVHHLKYTGDPWEAPNNHLITLCESCHYAFLGAYNSSLDDLHISLINSNFSSLEVVYLASFIEHCDPDYFHPANNLNLTK